MNEPAAPRWPEAVPASQAAPTQAPARADDAHVEAAMKAYVGFFAGYFEIGRLAAGRRLNRAGLREPLLHA